MPSFAECELMWTNCSIPAKIYRFRFELNKIHPAQKPVGLLKQILRDYYKEGIVLDCFSGSGSIAVACWELGIPFISIEKDREYFEKSVERFRIAQSQLRLF